MIEQSDLILENKQGRPLAKQAAVSVGDVYFYNALNYAEDDGFSREVAGKTLDEWKPSLSEGPAVKEQQKTLLNDAAHGQGKDLNTRLIKQE